MVEPVNQKRQLDIRTVSETMSPAGGEKITSSLIDTERNVIWRKAARREPGKLVRGLQAIASDLHPVIRLPAVDVTFLPKSVDYESRPYHIGWFLHAWPFNRTSEPLKQYSRLYKKPHLKA